MNPKKKMSNTCEDLKFGSWYDAALRPGQGTHQVLFEFHL